MLGGSRDRVGHPTTLQQTTGMGLGRAAARLLPFEHIYPALFGAF